MIRPILEHIINLLLNSPRDFVAASPQIRPVSSRQVNLVVWTIVLSVGVFCAAIKFFGPDFIPGWLTSIGPEAGVIAATVFAAVIIFLAGKSAARVARHQKASAGKFFVFLLVGLGCTELAKEFPIIGLGGLFAVYGLIGLTIIGFKKLSQRKVGPPIPASSDQNKLS